MRQSIQSETLQRRPRAQSWITVCPHQLLTEIPSCEAEHTGVPTNSACVKKVLANVHTRSISVGTIAKCRRLPRTSVDRGVNRTWQI